MANNKKLKARKDQILKAAERIFARKGFQEATVSDVAREAHVSDTTIYEYFSTKEELLFSIPDETTRKGMETLSFHLNYIRGATNKIRSIIYHLLWFYQNHPDYSSLIMLTLKQNRRFLETEAYQTIRKGFRIIVEVIEEGIVSGEFQTGTNPYLVRHVILGTIENIVFRRLLLGKPEDLLQYVDPLTDLITDGIRKGGRPKGWNVQITLEPQEEDQEQKSPSAPDAGLRSH